MTNQKYRIYPLCCTSMYCGRTMPDCLDCHYYQFLEDFNSWKERTGAVCADPVWCPRVYVEGGKNK